MVSHDGFAEELLLNLGCLQVYTDSNVDVPQTWEESDPKYINNQQEVRLRSFSTKVHKVDAMVAYRADEQ